mmetsp:Transcript_7350/g.17759  ORF Transcript_7350/g.17759 Transcript_7350/m.17759 type:complete len:194 (+) Transcript_7350:524-1105(+)
MRKALEEDQYSANGSIVDTDTDDDELQHMYKGQSIRLDRGYLHQAAKKLGWLDLISGNGSTGAASGRASVVSKDGDNYQDAVDEEGILNEDGTTNNPGTSSKKKSSRNKKKGRNQYTNRNNNNNSSTHHTQRKNNGNNSDHSSVHRHNTSSNRRETRRPLHPNRSRDRILARTSNTPKWPTNRTTTAKPLLRK